MDNMSGRVHLEIATVLKAALQSLSAGFSSARPPAAGEDARAPSAARFRTLDLTERHRTWL